MNPLLKFFVIAYVAAWPFFLAAGLPALSRVQGLVALVGTFAPGAAALWLTSRAAAMAWLYVHTRGSLLLAMLMHAAINNTKDIVPPVLLAPGNAFAFRGAPLTWLSVGVLWVVAAVLLFRMNGKV